MNIYLGTQKSLPLRTGHAAHASGNGKILNAHCVRTLRMHFCHQPELRDFCTFLEVLKLFCGCIFNTGWKLNKFLKYTFCVFFIFLGVLKMPLY